MDVDRRPIEVSRRAFGSVLGAGVLGAGGRSWASGASPAVVVPDQARPAIPCGTAVGDVSGRSGVVWARTDRPARMVVEWSKTGSFQDARRVEGPAALPEDDFTARVVLAGLPPGQRIEYRSPSGIWIRPRYRATRPWVRSGLPRTTRPTSAWPGRATPPGKAGGSTPHGAG